MSWGALQALVSFGMQEIYMQNYLEKNPIVRFNHVKYNRNDKKEYQLIKNKSANNMNSVCPICIDTIQNETDIIKTDCSHNYCFQCATQWYYTKQYADWKCLLCMKVLPKEEKNT